MTEFLILGEVQVRTANGFVRLGPRRTERLLLGLLLLEVGRTVPADRLVELLWETAGPRDPLRTLQAHVSRLRASLDPDRDGRLGIRIQSTGDGFVAHVDPNTVDAHRFRELVTSADQIDEPLLRIATLRTALGLWRGPLLADAADDRLRDRIGTGLRELRWQANEILYETELAVGRHREILAELTDLVGDAPFRERLVAALMAALYRTDRQVDALALYRDTHRRMIDEIGVEPGSLLSELHGRILRQDPALGVSAATGPNYLPRDVTRFVGRTKEVEALTNPAESAAVVIHTIDGMAGMGKTALAVHAAHRMASRFPDGQLYVDLQGHAEHGEPLAPADALDLMLRAVGVPDSRIPRTLQEKAGLWRAESARRSLLVLLDDAATSAQVRPLLPASPRSVVLITSRRRLTGLDVAVFSLDALPVAEACALFAQVVGPDRVAGETDAAEQAVRLCGFLPLAIVIVGALLRSHPTWTIDHLVHYLSGEHSRIELLAAEDHSVAAAFGLSYRHLPADEQRFYRLLAIHPGRDIDRHAAAAIAAIALRQADKLLFALCDAHLLTERRPGFYRFHDLVREHARACLASDEPESERTAAGVRLLDYYLFVSEVAADQLSPWRRKHGPAPEDIPVDPPAVAHPSDAIAWFESEQANFLAVVQMAIDSVAAQHGWQLPRNISAYLRLCGNHTMGVTVLRAGVEAWRPGHDPSGAAACLANLSLMLRGLGDIPAARDCVVRSMAHYRSAGDREGESLLLTALADLQVMAGDFADALTTSTKAIAVFRQEGNLVRETSAMAQHIDALVHLGRPREAIDAAQHLSVHPDDLSGRPAAIVLNRLGTAHSLAGDHEVAIAKLQRAVDIAREDQALGDEAEFLVRLAAALRRAGDLEAGHRCAVRALDLLTGPTDSGDLIDAHNVLGAILTDMGRAAEGLEHHLRGLSKAARVDNRIGRADALDGIGRAYAALGDIRAAREHWQQALTLYAELGVPQADEVRARLEGNSRPSQ